MDLRTCFSWNPTMLKLFRLTALVKFGRTFCSTFWRSESYGLPACTFKRFRWMMANHQMIMIIRFWSAVSIICSESNTVRLKSVWSSYLLCVWNISLQMYLESDVIYSILSRGVMVLNLFMQKRLAKTGQISCSIFLSKILSLNKCSLKITSH